LTLRPSKPTKAMTSKLRIVATSSASSKTTNDLGVATNFCMTPLGDQETMMKATVRPRRPGRLPNNYHTYSVTTTSIVVPCHPMLRRGHKTMTTTTPGRGRALHQVKMAFLASQVS
jgi:hypothetical protein